jgi:hypothetical protein
MKFIAHRGNLDGPSKEENKPTYIEQSISLGYDCEIDVRYIDQKLYLGHDTPDYEIDLHFLLHHSKKVWIHCKNVEALDYLLPFDLNLFWHQEDHYTLTSKGFIWCYPGMNTTKRSIIVMPEWNDFRITEAYGVCSDFIHKLETDLI